MLTAGRHATRTTTAYRSYDHEGNQLVWQPTDSSAETRYACDLEQMGRAPDWMARRFGSSSPIQFLCDWVCTEALAKLADVPILVWLKERELVRPPSPRVAQNELEFEIPDFGATVLLKTLPATGHVMALAYLMNNGSNRDGIQ